MGLVCQNTVGDGVDRLVQHQFRGKGGAFVEQHLTTVLLDQVRGFGVTFAPHGVDLFSVTWMHIHPGRGFNAQRGRFWRQVGTDAVHHFRRNDLRLHGTDARKQLLGKLSMSAARRCECQTCKGSASVTCTDKRFDTRVRTVRPNHFVGRCKAGQVIATQIFAAEPEISRRVGVHDAIAICIADDLVHLGLARALLGTSNVARLRGGLVVDRSVIVERVASNGLTCLL